MRLARAQQLCRDAPVDACRAALEGLDAFAPESPAVLARTDLDGVRPRATLTLARAAQRAGHPNEVVRLLEPLWRERPSLEASLAREIALPLAQSLQHLERHDEAIAVADDALRIALTPDTRWARLGLAAVVCDLASPSACSQVVRGQGDLGLDGDLLEGKSRLIHSDCDGAAQVLTAEWRTDDGELRARLRVGLRLAQALRACHRFEEAETIQHEALALSVDASVRVAALAEVGLAPASTDQAQHAD